MPHDSQHTTEVRTARASATTRHWPQTPPHISVTGMVSIRDTRGPPDAEIINTPYSLYKNRFYIAKIMYLLSATIMSCLEFPMVSLFSSAVPSKISRDSNSQVPIGLISAQALIIMSVMEGQICSRSLYFK